MRRQFCPGEVAIYTEETPRDLIPGLYCALQGDACRQSLLGSERTVFNGCLGDMGSGQLSASICPLLGQVPTDCAGAGLLFVEPMFSRTGLRMKNGTRCSHGA
jgi:hypothetical protein